MRKVERSWAIQSQQEFELSWAIPCAIWSSSPQGQGIERSWANQAQWQFEISWAIPGATWSSNSQAQGRQELDKSMTMAVWTIVRNSLRHVVFQLAGVRLTGAGHINDNSSLSYHEQFFEPRGLPAYKLKVERSWTNQWHWQLKLSWAIPCAIWSSSSQVQCWKQLDKFKCSGSLRYHERFPMLFDLPAYRLKVERSWTKLF